MARFSPSPLLLLHFETSGGRGNEGTRDQRQPTFAKATVGTLRVDRERRVEAAGFAPASENTSPQEYYDAYPLLICRP